MPKIEQSRDLIIVEINITTDRAGENQIAEIKFRSGDDRYVLNPRLVDSALLMWDVEFERELTVQEYARA